MTLVVELAARAVLVVLAKADGFISQTKDDLLSLGESHGMTPMWPASTGHQLILDRPEDIFGSLEVDGTGQFVGGNGKYQASGRLRMVVCASPISYEADGIHYRHIQNDHSKWNVSLSQ